MILKRSTIANGLRRINLWMSIFWALMVIPAVTLWKNSITFLAIVSVYALFQGHLNAYMAGRAEQRADENGSDTESEEKR